MKNKIVFIKTRLSRCYCQKCRCAIFRGNLIAYDTHRRVIVGCESCVSFLKNKRRDEQVKEDEYYFKERYIGNYDDESLEIFDFM